MLIRSGRSKVQILILNFPAYRVITTNNTNKICIQEVPKSHFFKWKPFDLIFLSHLELNISVILHEIVYSNNLSFLNCGQYNIVYVELSQLPELLIIWQLPLKILPNRWNYTYEDYSNLFTIYGECNIFLSRTRQIFVEKYSDKNYRKF